MKWQHIIFKIEYFSLKYLISVIILQVRWEYYDNKYNKYISSIYFLYHIFVYITIKVYYTNVSQFNCYIYIIWFCISMIVSKPDSLHLAWVVTGSAWFSLQEAVREASPIVGIMRLSWLIDSTVNEFVFYIYTISVGVDTPAV